MPVAVRSLLFGDGGRIVALGRALRPNRCPSWDGGLAWLVGLAWLAWLAGTRLVVHLLGLGSVRGDRQLGAG